MGRIEVWEWPGQNNEKEKNNTKFNYKLKFNLASSYFHIFTTMGSMPLVSPVHTLAPDPFHRTIFLNSENYDEANMLDSMADSAKLWNLLSTTSWIWVHLFVQGARQNHASKSQNQTMPSILLKNQASTEGSVMWCWCTHSGTSLQSVAPTSKPKAQESTQDPWDPSLDYAKM